MSKHEQIEGRAYSKAARRRAKKAKRDNPLGLPEIGATPKRQKNGQKHRPAEERGADKVALKARCRQRGVSANAANLRDSRSPWWGCRAGRAMAGAVEGHAERLELWDAIQHMRRVVTAYDAAIGAPRRHAVCLRLLVPIERMEATAETPPVDDRTPEDRARQAVSAYMQLEGWLGWTDKAAMGEAKRVVWDDAEARDVPGLLAALRCVSDGVKGRRMVWRGRHGNR
ncbi:hypothetical protein [Pseudodonghicola flavimaris]|uniref:Uncharacterized protein n=1 Tax=Pseudodonghicola flavimaris TaxID=3050036 RepID=A0ABT7EW34_9RHOB|nr:hypothetical protein [Pseudodonghicola flavimaris]MDK3016533.1 hypothetical protein [Pseudodonghicola flavimaris]